MPMLSVLFALAFASPADSLQFAVTFYKGPDPALHVELTFRGSPSGATLLHLPSEWGGQRDLHRAIHGVTVTSGGAPRPDPVAPHRIWVTHPPGGRVTVQYQVRQDFEGPLSQGAWYRPLVQTTWFHAIGTAWLIVPQGDPDAAIHAAFTWSGLSPDDAIATSFGARQRVQEVLTTRARLTHALYVGGDFRLMRVEATGGHVEAAVRGAGAFSDAEFAETLARVFTAARDFWQDPGAAFHLVSAIETEPGGFGGTRLNGAFATFVGTGTPLDMRLTRLLAHELVHDWIGGALRPGEVPEALSYGFTEGFTDFFTEWVLLRGGFLDAAARAAAVNLAIQEYAMLPVRDEPFAIVAERFWSDRAVSRLPYLRGHLLALHLDHWVREASGSTARLEDVMRELLREARDHPAQTLAVTDSTLAAALAPVLGLEQARSLLERHLRRGEPFPFPASLLGRCFERRLETLPRFDPGLDLEASIAERRAIGVDDDGPAYAAGLRDGMRLSGWSVTFGDPSQPVRMIVMDEESRRTEIVYAPVGAAAVTVPRYDLIPDCVPEMPPPRWGNASRPGS